MSTYVRRPVRVSTAIEAFRFDHRAAGSARARRYVTFAEAHVRLPVFRGETAPERVPAIDPLWVADPSFLRAAARAMDLGSPASPAVLLTGPAGCGKTFAVEQLAARLGAPLWTVQCSADTREAHLLGAKGLRNGSSAFEPGPVLQCYERGGWLLLDEFTAVPAGQIQCLHGILAGATTCARQDGTLVRRGAGFLVFATTNIIGLGAMERRAYPGNHTPNLATVSRFGHKVQLSGPSAASVRALLERWAHGSTRPDPLREADAVAAWFVRLSTRANEEYGVAGHAMTLRELRDFWAAVHRPLLDHAGRAQFENVTSIAEYTVLTAFTAGPTRASARELLVSLLPRTRGA